MDERIEKAIRDAVYEASQSDQLANRLVAWIDAAISGNVDLADKQATDTHLDIIYEAVEIDEELL